LVENEHRIDTEFGKVRRLEMKEECDQNAYGGAFQKSFCWSLHVAFLASTISQLGNIVKIPIIWLLYILPLSLYALKSAGFLHFTLFILIACIKPNNLFNMPGNSLNLCLNSLLLKLYLGILPSDLSLCSILRGLFFSSNAF
jgi:hypothetical protein